MKSLIGVGSLWGSVQKGVLICMLCRFFVPIILAVTAVLAVPVVLLVAVLPAEGLSASQGSRLTDESRGQSADQPASESTASTCEQLLKNPDQNQSGDRAAKNLNTLQPSFEKVSRKPVESQSKVEKQSNWHTNIQQVQKKWAAAMKEQIKLNTVEKKRLQKNTLKSEKIFQRLRDNTTYWPYIAKYLRSAWLDPLPIYRHLSFKQGRTFYQPQRDKIEAVLGALGYYLVQDDSDVYFNTKHYGPPGVDTPVVDAPKKYDHDYLIPPFNWLYKLKQSKLFKKLKPIDSLYGLFGFRRQQLLGLQPEVFHQRNLLTVSNSAGKSVDVQLKLLAEELPAEPWAVSSALYALRRSFALEVVFDLYFDSSQSWPQSWLQSGPRAVVSHHVILERFFDLLVHHRWAKLLFYDLIESTLPTDGQTPQQVKTALPTLEAHNQFKKWLHKR